MKHKEIRHVAREGVFHTSKEIRDIALIGATKDRKTKTSGNSEKRIAILADSMNTYCDTVVITDIYNVIIHVNIVFQELYGYTKTELTGKHIDIIRAKSVDRATSDKILKMSLDSGWSGELLNIDKSGREFPVFLSTSKVIDAQGNPIALIGIARDISAQKAAEKTLKEKIHVEEFLTSMTAKFINVSLPEIDDTINYALQQIGILTYSDMVHLVQVKKSTHGQKSVYCWNKEENSEYSTAFHRECAEFFTSAFKHNPDLNQFFVHRLPENQKRSRALQNFLVENNMHGAFAVSLSYRNKFTGYFALFTKEKISRRENEDFSYLNILGEVLSNALERKKVEEELHRAKSIAEESARIRDQFLTRMNHEFRTPLHAILGSSYLMLKTNPNPKQLEYVETVRVAADILLALVNDMLDFSKIRAGKIEFSSVDFSLPKIVDQVFQVARISAERKFLKLHYTISPEIPRILIGDPERLTQILVNLVINAIKFTNKGEVSISIAPIFSENNKIHVQFEIRDTGIGIEKKNISAIFNDFVRGSDSGKKMSEGTGLGLTICKMLVTLQGGKISVESKPDKGSLFRFTVPYLISANQNIEHVSPEDDPILPGALRDISILVVEDNEFNRLIIKDLLQTWKANYKIAEHGKKALSLIKSHHFDLILMDIGLPDIDGCDLTKHIRKNLSKKHKNIPIIAMTAAAAADEKMKALKSGMNDYITKPFHERSLFFKITSLLRVTTAPSKHTINGNRKLKKQLAASKYFEPEKLLYEERITKEFLCEIIESFLENAPHIVNELILYNNMGGYTEVAASAHKAKSMYAYLQLRKGVKIIREIEVCAKSKPDFEKLEKSLRALKTMTYEIIKEMKFVLIELKANT